MMDDFKILPQPDTKHPLSGSCSVFGLSQNEYVKAQMRKYFYMKILIMFLII